uniref:Ig-like domain-containing protein n=1 Tax=Timema shepardi TaxID=629360 RepID=A0A7R9AST8_TIMSH|nr:unnamed protein product [Timema shepardi]
MLLLLISPEISSHLTSDVPPEQPAIFDRWGRQLNSTVGPHDEGDDVMLTCRVIGGRKEKMKDPKRNSPPGEDGTPEDNSYNLFIKP